MNNAIVSLFQMPQKYFIIKKTFYSTMFVKNRTL